MQTRGGNGMEDKKVLIYADDARREILREAPQLAYIIDRIKPADAVEVVRCKDCKHWSDGVAGCTDHVKCCKIGFYMVGENGYCVYGERKGNELQVS